MPKPTRHQHCPTSVQLTAYADRLLERIRHGAETKFAAGKITAAELEIEKVNAEFVITAAKSRIRDGVLETEAAWN